MKKTAKSILLLLCIAVILLTSVSCAWILRSKKTENVFDRLYYEVKSAKWNRWGKESILLTGTETAYADYDLGTFQSIQIPDLNMSLSFDSRSLYMLFFYGNDAENKNVSYFYRYDVCEKKLYGEETLEYLTQHFLSHYFEWCKNAGEENAYSLQHLGSYTFTLQEKVYDN